MPAGEPTSFRLTLEALARIKELEAHLGLKRTAVLELAVRRLHRAEIPAGKKSQKIPDKRG